MQKDLYEPVLQKVIGKNLKTARVVVADMSMSHVMLQVWEVKGNKNRLSEIENGSRLPSPYILMRLSMLYGVSLDFIFGLSHDIERDLEFSRAGRITQGLREIACDMVDRIGLALAEQVNILPRMDAIILRDKAMAVLNEVRSAEWGEDGVLIKNAENFRDLIQSLESACLHFDSAVAKHSRIMELAVLDHIERTDSKITGRYLTDKNILLDQPVSFTSLERELMIARAAHQSEDEEQEAE